MYLTLANIFYDVKIFRCLCLYLVLTTIKGIHLMIDFPFIIDQFASNMQKGVITIDRINVKGVSTHFENTNLKFKTHISFQMFW
jgi:hypothetical protein